MSGWSGEAFFPIGVWLQSPGNAARYHAAGINTYVGLWNGPTAAQLTALQSTGMRIICSQNETALHHPAASNIIAWMQPDEPDNGQRWGARLGWGDPIPPGQIVAGYRRMKTNDATRPIFLGLGQGVAWHNWYGRGSRNRHPEDYPRYLEGCDIASFDIYPVNHSRAEVAGNLWYVPLGVERLRAWTRDEKPVWNSVEVTGIYRPEGKPTPHEVRAEVWMALIHGSRGIIYFAHQFKPTFSEAALLEDPQMLAAVTTLNRQITDLAPVLLSPVRTNGVTVTSQNPAQPIAVTVRESAGQTYIFAVAMRTSTSQVNFKLSGVPKDPKVEVLGEKRTLQVNTSGWTDQFNAWDVHLYRVTANPP